MGDKKYTIHMHGAGQSGKLWEDLELRLTLSEAFDEANSISKENSAHTIKIQPIDDKNEKP